MKIQVYIEGVPTMVHTSELTYKDNGDVYKHYTSDMDIDTDKELELANEEFNKDRKNNGTAYTKADGTEYLVSLTAEDANGLVTVKVGFDMGSVTSTNFVFSNGTIVPIASLDELLHLGAFIVTERNSFFT